MRRRDSVALGAMGGLAIVVLAVAAVAVTSRPIQAPGSFSSATPVNSDVGALIPAAHSQCAVYGEQVVTYLKSGNNGGDPQLDVQFANVRAGIITQPVAAQPGLIRAAADSGIQTCDRQLDAQASSAADQAALNDVFGNLANSLNNFDMNSFNNQ